jgi:hypothetical protein
MAVRLVVTFHAAPGKGAELAQAMKARCEVSRQDAGCETAGAAPAFAGGAAARRWRARGLHLQPYPLNGEAPKARTTLPAPSPSFRQAPSGTPGRRSPLRRSAE